MVLRRDGKATRRTLYLIRMRRLFALMGLAVLLAAAASGYWIFIRPAGPRAETFVDIAPGTSTRAVSWQLYHSGVIASPYGIEILRAVAGGTLKAGEYRFEHPARVDEVYRRLARGDVYTIALTIPEGANLFDVAARVEAAGLGPRVGFLAAAKQQTALIATLDPHAVSLEGYLFPSTYRFSRHVSAAAMLRTMVRQFEAEAAALGISASDAHRVVTLASLVERETPIPSERPLVASVFINRLAQGMPLETDPSVIYAALQHGAYRGAIYQSDLHYDSPYNTYLHAGLPPGPICNPGLVSLRAALQPPRTDYLYFVAAGSDPSGHSLFAATLAEHQRNVQAYREAIREAAAAHPGK